MLTKWGFMTVAGLTVAATVGLGVSMSVGVAATLFAGVMLVGVSSDEEATSEPTGISNRGSKPKVDEKKSVSPPVSAQEKRPSEATKKQTSKTTANSPLESQSDQSPERKSSASNVSTSTSVEPKSERVSAKKTSVPNGKVSSPNRERSSSVVMNLNRPSNAITSTSTSRDVVSNNVELEAQIAPEVKEWRDEGYSKQGPKKRSAALVQGVPEKRSSPAIQPTTETISPPELSAGVNSPGPLPLLPPSPIPKPKSISYLSEAIVDTESKPTQTITSVAEPINEKKPMPVQGGTSQENSKIEDHPPIVPLTHSTPLPVAAAPDLQSEAPTSSSHSQRSETQRRINEGSSSSSIPAVSAPVEQSTVLVTDVMLATTLVPKIEADPLDVSSVPMTTDSNGVVRSGSGVLHGPASASRDSLASVQRRNLKLSSAAKKVSHSVKKVFKGPDGKVIHSDPQRLISPSSDSINSRFTVDSELIGPAIPASSSRESLASTKSRRSLIDGSKKTLKRMFRGSSDNVAIPPVPQLPDLNISTIPQLSVDSEKPAVIPSTNTLAPKPLFAQPHTSISNSVQSTRNAPGAPDAKNNASPLLKGIFKGRNAPRGRR